MERNTERNTAGSVSIMLGSGLLTLALLVFGIGWGMEQSQSPSPAPAATLVSSTPDPIVLGMTPEQAALIALHTSIGARLAGTPTLMTLDGAPTYVVPLDWGTVYVHATTGQVVRNDTTPPMPYHPAADSPAPASPAPASPAADSPAPASPAVDSPAVDSPAPQVPPPPAQPVQAPQPANTGGPITPEQAVTIALAYAGGGDVRRVERDVKNGIETYEVKFTDGREVYVDVNTGTVVYAELMK